MQEIPALLTINAPRALSHFGVNSKRMQLLFPQQQQPESRPTSAPVNVSVPFLQESMGLGDAVAAITQKVGIQPCGGCKKRQEALNRVQLNPFRG